jgi:hypothetical protein
MNLIEVAPRDKFRLFLRYDDGVEGVLDVSALAGRGVFSRWLEPGVFDAVRLSAAGCPEWPGDLDLCADALYLQLTGKRPEEVFPALTNLTAHA